jgi:hypothetical protein
METQRTTENGNGGTPESVVEYTLNFDPQTEDQLIGFAVPAKPLSRLMRRLLTGYVIGFNHRHDRRGQLFQNRYKSIICQEETYLRELVRYIHLNND